MSRYTVKSEIDKRKFFISKAVGSLLVDISDGKYILEEATVDEGENRTVFRISLLHSKALKEDYIEAQKHTQKHDAQTWIDYRQRRNLECGCPTNKGTEKKETSTGNTETLGKVIDSTP